MSDPSMAQAGVIVMFVAKGFSPPPGAAAAIKIQQKTQDAVAESSRKVAMVSVELQKWTVEKLIMMHDAVMKNAVEYVRAIASGPDMISRVVGIGYDAQQKLISAVASYYNARTQAKDVMSKVAQYNNSITFDASKANQAGELSVLDKVVALRNAAMQGATDYSKALASAPDIISKMSGIGYDAQSKLISSASQYYNARTQAKEAVSKVTQYNNTIAFDSAKANQMAKLSVTEMNLKALLADISSIAQQATAALNNLHVGVTMQAGGSTITTQAQVDVPGT